MGKRHAAHALLQLLEQSPACPQLGLGAEAQRQGTVRVPMPADGQAMGRPVGTAVDARGGVLVADDVADSGRTMELVMEILLANGAEVRTVVLYTKPSSVFRVDFVWKQTDAWIVFPWSALPPVTAG